ncbi:transporter [Escherichia coli]|nr:transporter [Escherichia coli]
MGRNDLLIRTFLRSDIDLQGDAELTITGFLIGFCIVQLKQ